MLNIRRASDRGHADHGWLDTRHTFSFADYYDPEHMGFRSLRVINDDRVAPGAGFPTHPHRDMEIISYVLEGTLEHQDSMGNGSVIRPGDVQRMTAGTGVTHSEFNPSSSEPVRFLQIWIVPERQGLRPGYEQKSFPPADRQGRLKLVASPDGREDSITVHQDVRVYTTTLRFGDELSYELEPGRHVWVQVARGRASVNGQEIEEGDGASISMESQVRLSGVANAELLLFDLA